MTRSIEVVVHCWRYSRALSWQYRSIYENYWSLEMMGAIPVDSVRLTVCCAPIQFDIATHELIDGIAIKQIVQPKSELFNRAIGRNIAARESTADWVWFADADYFFGPDALRVLAETDPGDGKLFFPRMVLTHHTHAMGDKYLESGWGLFNSEHFFPRTMHKAIGGIQIVPGHVAREHGYCDWPKMQRPVEGDLMADTRSDRAFRASLGTYGTPLDLPGVFRIRHSTSGLNRGKGGVERFTGN